MSRSVPRILRLETSERRAIKRDSADGISTGDSLSINDESLSLGESELRPTKSLQYQRLLAAQPLHDVCA